MQVGTVDLDHCSMTRRQRRDRQRPFLFARRYNSREEVDETIADRSVVAVG